MNRGFLGEFKEFIMRGNVFDMAIGIIIGSAFTAIVTSLVNDIINPLISLVTGGIDLSGLAIDLGNDVFINYGVFLQSVISFVLVALCVFCMIKGINSLRRKKEEEPPAPPAPSKEEILLTEIRDLLKNRQEK